MNCGVFSCQEYIRSLGGRMSGKTRRMLEEHVRQGEISIQDILDVMNASGYLLQAYRTDYRLFVPPYIIYLPRSRHFLTVLSVGSTVKLMDNRLGSVEIPLLFYRILYRRILLCDPGQAA